MALDCLDFVQGLRSFVGPIGLSFHYLLKTPLFSIDCDIKMQEMASLEAHISIFFPGHMPPDPLETRA